MKIDTAIALGYSNRLPFLLAALLLTLLLGSSTAAKATEKLGTIKYLALPVVSNSLAKGFYDGIANQVNQHTGKKISFFFPSSYCQTIRYAAESPQDFDIIYLPTQTAPMMMRQLGYTPIIVSRNPGRGMFVFRNQQQAIQRPFKIALGDKYSATGFIAQKNIADIMSQDPSTAGIDPASVKFVNYRTHDQALVAFLQGDSDAAAISDIIFNQSMIQVRSDLKSIGFTTDYPRVVLLARPGLDQQTQQRLTKAFALAKGALPDSDPFSDVDLKAADASDHQRLLAMPNVDIAQCLASKKPLTKPYYFSQ